MAGLGIAEVILLFCVIGLVIVVAATALLVVFMRGQAASRHVELAGLESDDHLQYLLSNGVRPMAGDLELGGNRIRGLPTAVAEGQAVPYEQALKPGDLAAGDLSGAFPNPQVTGLQGQPVSTKLPAVGQVLVWNGSEWEPRDLPGENTPSE